MRYGSARCLPPAGGGHSSNRLEGRLLSDAVSFPCSCCVDRYANSGGRIMVASQHDDAILPGSQPPVCVVSTSAVSFVKPKVFTGLRDKCSTNCILDSISRTHLVWYAGGLPQHSSELWWPASYARRLLLRASVCKGRTQGRIKTSPCGRLSPSGQSFISRLLAEARDCTISLRDNFPGREANLPRGYTPGLVTITNKLSLVYFCWSPARGREWAKFRVLLQSVRRALEEALTHSPVLQIFSSKDQ